MNKIKIQEDVIYNKGVKNSLKIIQIADIHFNNNTKIEKLKVLSNCINSEKADYVVIVGDTIDNGDITNNLEKIKELFDFFQEISSCNKVIISLGNHDIRTSCGDFFVKLNKIKNVYVLDNDIYQDENVYISGFNLPKEYYYNGTGDESVPLFTHFIDNNHYLTNNLPKSKFKIALIHSPLKISNKEIQSRIQGYNMVLCGHTHDGMVFELLKFFFRGNRGIISPCKKLFPKFARGRVDFDNGLIMIITGGVTKLSLSSAKWLNKLNFVYNIGMNRIIIRKEV